MGVVIKECMNCRSRVIFKRDETGEMRGVCKYCGWDFYLSEYETQSEAAEQKADGSENGYGHDVPAFMKELRKADGYGGETPPEQEKAAPQPDAKEFYEQGMKYLNGDGVQRDAVKAVELLRKAAEQGNADAQNNLGKCYYYGRGVSKDYAEAVKWFRKAAEQGYVTAQCILGECYYYGTGVNKDKEYARTLLEKAAAGGSEVAKGFLENHVEFGRL